jgi:hypothetical protein
LCDLALSELSSVVFLPRRDHATLMVMHACIDVDRFCVKPVKK